MIELRDREIFTFPPIVRPIDGVPDATVIYCDNMIGIGSINPHIVKITVCTSPDIIETFATVIAHDKPTISLVQFFRILWIDNQVGKVEWSPQHILTAIFCDPSLPSVIGAIETIVRRRTFDKTINCVWTGRSNCDCKASPWFCGKSLGG